MSRKIILEETDNYVRNAQLNPAWLGKELSRQEWPANIQEYVDRLNEVQGEEHQPMPGMPYIGPQNDGSSSKTAMAL